MRNKELVNEIATYKKQMRKLAGEFMKAKNINEANDKVDKLIELAGKVAALKEVKKQNGYFAKKKKKLGL